MRSAPTKVIGFPRKRSSGNAVNNAKMHKRVQKNAPKDSLLLTDDVQKFSYSALLGGGSRPDDIDAEKIEAR